MGVALEEDVRSAACGAAAESVADGPTTRLTGVRGAGEHHLPDDRRVASQRPARAPAYDRRAWPAPGQISPPATSGTPTVAK
jgi:hypothetical protein